MSYFLAAAALTRSSVEIAGIGSDSAQGDTGLVDVLRHMGCAAIFDDKRLILRGTRQINGVEVDMETMPDTVLTLAALAATVSGTTRITNIANLRVKESDRIHAAAVELSKLGADVEEGPDFLTIRSTGRLRPTAIDTYDDHRVAMAFGVLTLITEGITIKNPECVGKSFPQFWDELDRLRNHLVSLVEDTNPLNAVG
jgi:3-phosphoshikimate 1-carboxyvinyltransferase